MFEYQNEPFDFADLSYLAIALPDEIRYLKYAGDFQGECAAIDRLCRRDDLPLALKKRLWLEKVIACGMEEDYRLSVEDMLADMRKTYADFSKEDLTALMEATRQIDFIRRGDKIYFQDAAPAILREVYEERLPSNRQTAGCRPEKDRLRYENAERMLATGKSAYRFTLRESIRVCPEALCREPILFHLPFPAECPSQSEIRLLASSHPVRISGAAQRTAAIQLDSYAGEEVFIEFSYVNCARLYRPEPSRIDAKQPDFYTGEEYPHIRFTPFLRELAREIAGDEVNPLRLARRVYDYVTRTILYSYLREYLLIDNIPEFTALNGRGDCGAQALLFITLCRILGIPARWESGKSVLPTHCSSHDWSMFYLAPYGWMYADLSAGGGAFASGDTFLHDFYFGSIDPFRMVANTEFQRAFEPPKVYMRDDPYDNQNGEAEYRSHGLSYRQLEKHSEVLSAEELS